MLAQRKLITRSATTVALLYFLAIDQLSAQILVL